jgi:hypothetical protein
MDNRQGDAVPAAEFDEVLDGGNGDPKHLRVARQKEDAARR